METRRRDAVGYLKVIIGAWRGWCLNERWHAGGRLGAASGCREDLMSKRGGPDDGEAFAVLRAQDSVSSVVTMPLVAGHR